jgi:hypothetical protein
MADFGQAPFTMYVNTVTIQECSCGSEYIYGGESSSWQSIEISGSCNGQAVSPGSVGSSSTPISSNNLSSFKSSSSSSVSVQPSTATVSTTATRPQSGSNSTIIALPAQNHSRRARVARKAPAYRESLLTTPRS